MQVTTVSRDPDTGVLSLSLLDGSQYQILNPGIARQVYANISPGGVIKDDQHAWLQQFRIQLTKSRNDRLLAICQQLRSELKGVKRGQK